MENNRKLIRLNVGDFLEIKPVDKGDRSYKGKTRDLTLMGICFSSQAQWERGQVLEIDYFISEEMDSFKIKIVVVWSEFIDTAHGYFCGGEIIEIEEGKQDKFAGYYLKRLQERFSK
ncbi:MAG: PilZ domain-containing protein [Candidatus Omnitrophota bacterium]